MYQLNFTAEYSAGLRSLIPLTGHLTAVLYAGLYHVLERNPLEIGRAVPGTTVRLIRKMLLSPILLVEVLYRVDEERKIVDLVAIRAIDTALM